MNKLNLLLLIVLVALASGCRKVELPDPKVEEAVFGFWSGQIGETPMVINNDSMFMTTKITKDPDLNINTFETSFTPLGSTQAKWILKYRDSKSIRTAADTADLFYTNSESRYLKASLINDTGGVVTHTLKNIAHGHEVTWKNFSDEVKGGRHFSVEKTNLSGINNVTASISDNGKTNSIQKIFWPSIGDINIEEIKISGKDITIILEPHLQGNFQYKMNGISNGISNKLEIPNTGEYKIEISETSKNRYLVLTLNLEVSNGTVKQPKLPLFSSNHGTQYPKLPNFSKMEIIYYDEDGKEYSTRYTEQPKPFIIYEIETFHKTNLQGQKVKKVNIEFSVTLKTANGSDSLVFTRVKGDIGFAYE
jgi:hypothetical protein